MGLFDSLQFKVGLDVSPVKAGMAEIATSAKVTGAAAQKALKPLTLTTAQQAKMTTATKAATTAVKAESKALDQAAASANKVAAANKSVAASTDTATKSTAKLGVGTQALAQQLPDVISGFAGGQRAMQIFTQQGLQVAQQTGLLQKAMVAVGAAGPVATTGVALVTSALAVGALAYTAWTDAARDAAKADDLFAVSIDGVSEAVEANQQRMIALRLASGDLTAQQAALETSMRSAFIGTLGAMEESQAKMTELHQTQGGIAAGLGDIADAAPWGPLAWATDLATTSGSEYEQQLDAISEAQGVHIAALKERRDIEEQLSILAASAPVDRVDNSAKVARLAQKEEREAARAAKAAAAELVKLTDELARSRESAVKSQLEGIALVEHERDVEVARAKEIAALRPQLAAEAAETIVAIERAAADEIAEIRAAAAEADAEALEKKIADAQKTVDAHNKAAEDIAAKERAVEDAKADYAKGIGKDMLSTAGEIGDAMVARGGEAAMKGFAISQAAAIGEIGINTATAVMKGFAIFGPPPSPAGIAAGAAAVIMGGVQAAIVSSTPPPTFHSGGMLAPDENMTQIRSLRGEASMVLNKRASDAKRDALDRTNATGVSGDGATFLIAAPWKHLGRASVDALDTSASFRKKVASVANTRASGARGY